MVKCIVVDDVEVTRFTAREFLEEMGVDVRVFEEGESAINGLRSEMADVVFLDWHIGQKSGLDSLKVIREEFGSHPAVVVFSGVENATKQEEAIQAGANVFIQKPTTHEKIKDAFEQLGIAV